MLTLSWDALSAGFIEQQHFCIGYSPLYEAIFAHAAGIAGKHAAGQPLEFDEQALVDLLETEWADVKIPNANEAALLLPASIHAAVLNGEAEGLSRFFATVGGSYDPKQDRAVLMQILGGLYLKPPAITRAVLHSGHLQTNEVSRGVVWLLPALILGTRVAPLHTTVIDLGCSAGLNLAADGLSWKWTVPYGPGGDRTMGGGDPIITQELHFGVESDVRDMMAEGSLRPPDVVKRLGIDRNPPNLDNPDDLLKLRACIWGDQPVRLERFDKAVIAFKTVPFPPEIEKGDLIEAARTLHTRITPETKLLIVMNTFVGFFMSNEAFSQLKANIFESFSQLPPDVQALWVELEAPRHDEPEVPKGLFPLKISTFKNKHLRMSYYAFMESHPRVVTLLPGWDYLWNDD